MIRLNVGGDFRFPLVSVVQQFLLVVQQLLVALRGELEVGSFDDCVHRASFLKEKKTEKKMFFLCFKSQYYRRNIID